ERLFESGAARGPVTGGVDEAAVPEHCQATVVGVESEIEFFREADTDCSRASAFEKVAVDHSFVESDQLHFAGDEAYGISGFVAIGEVSPDGGDLAINGAVEDIGQCRLPIGEWRGHASAGAIGERAEQVMMEPVAAEACRHGGKTDGLDTTGSQSGKSMAFDAGEALRADEAAAAGFDAFFVIRCDMSSRRGSSQRGISGLKC